MVEVNLTLLIQMAHFIGAYVLLRVFLWKPIIKYLQDEERHRAALGDELQKQRSIVEQKEFDLVSVQTQAQSAFATRIPLLTLSMTRKRSPLEKFSIPVASFSPEHMDRIVEVIVEKANQ